MSTPRGATSACAQFVERAREAGAQLVDSDDERLHKLCGTHRHQGVVARVEAGGA